MFFSAHLNKSENIHSSLQALAGLGPSIFSLLTIWAAFPTWGTIVYPEIRTFPEWALTNDTSEFYTA